MAANPLPPKTLVQKLKELDEESHARRVFMAYNRQKFKSLVNSSLKGNKEFKESYERLAMTFADELFLVGLDLVIHDLAECHIIIPVQASSNPTDGNAGTPAVPAMPVAWKLVGHFLAEKKRETITRQDLLYFGQGETTENVEKLLNNKPSDKGDHGQTKVYPLKANPVAAPGVKKYNTVGAQLLSGSAVGLDLGAVKAKVGQILNETLSPKTVLPPVTNAQVVSVPVAVDDTVQSTSRHRREDFGLTGFSPRNRRTPIVNHDLPYGMERPYERSGPRGSMLHRIYTRKSASYPHDMAKTKPTLRGIADRTRVMHGRVKKGKGLIQNHKIAKAAKWQRSEENISMDALRQVVDDGIAQNLGMKIPAKRETTSRHSIVETAPSKTFVKKLTHDKSRIALWDALETVAMQGASQNRPQAATEDAAASVVAKFIDEVLDRLPLQYTRGSSLEHISGIVLETIQDAIQDAIEPFENADPLVSEKKLVADFIDKVLKDRFKNPSGAVHGFLGHLQHTTGSEESEEEPATKLREKRKRETQKLTSSNINRAGTMTLPVRTTRVRTSPIRTRPTSGKTEPQAGGATRRDLSDRRTRSIPQAAALKHHDLPPAPKSLRRKAPNPVYFGPRTRSRSRCPEQSACKCDAAFHRG
jgi:hypothetical protein